MRGKMNEKIKTVLVGTKPGAGRQIYLDELRVLATIAVICVHTVSLAATLTVPGSTGYKILELLNFLFSSCNLLFIMISGALLLSVKGEKWSTFFIRRFSKVAMPMVVYYVLYICAKRGFAWLMPDHWLPMLKLILSGAPEEAPHFWLIYVILELYLLTPFLRWMVQHMSDAVLTGLMWTVFVVNAIETYAPIFGIDTHLSPIVDSFAGVFLFGYFLSKDGNKRKEDFIIIGGVISFILSCITIMMTNHYTPYIFNNAPTMMLFAGAIFLIFKKALKNKKNENLFVRLMAKYSFSILLIHWGVLHVAVKQILHVNVLSGGIIGGCLLMIFLTLIISIVGAVIVDNTLIRWIHTGFAAIKNIVSVR